MDILKYISNTVTNKYRDPASRTSTFTFGGYFVYLPLTEDSNKFEKLKEGVLDNSFMNEGQKTYNFSLFSKMQAVYWGLKKFVKIWRWNRSKPASVDIDLYMNALKTFPDSQKAKILHHGMIYEFRLTDIANIWIKSLTQSVTFSPQPVMPKNPYLNMSFNKGHLFHFYMCMKDNAKFSIPVIIQKFINCSMDLKLFRVEAYTDLVHEAIDNHISSSPFDILFLDCVNMLACHKRKLRGRRLSLDLIDSKKRDVVKQLKPILKLHLYATMSCNPAIRAINKHTVIDRLEKFFTNKPTFGRRIVRVTRRSVELSPPLFVFRAGSTNSDDNNEVLDDSEIDDVETDLEEELQEDPASGAAVGFSNEVRSTINEEFMDEEEY